MQCFICVIYLVISCKALPYEDREISSIENATSFYNKDMDAGTQPNDELEIPDLIEPHPNGTQVKVSEINLESIDKNNGLNDTIKPQKESNATTIKPITASTSESMFSEYIKYMVTVAKETDLLFRPILNEMEDMSQIGDTDRLTIINPTVIVNFRGTIWNKDSDLKLGQRKKDKSKPENIFD